MAKDISLSTRYIYFHPLNPLCERGKGGGREDSGCVSKDRWAGSGSNPAQADSRMLRLLRMEGRRMRHSTDTLNPNQRMDVVWSSRNLSRNLVGTPATLKPIKCRQRHYWCTICSNWGTCGISFTICSANAANVIKYYTESFVEKPFTNNFINDMLKVSLPSWPSSSCRTLRPTEILMLLFFLKNLSVSRGGDRKPKFVVCFSHCPPSVLRKAAASNKPALLRLD